MPPPPSSRSKKKSTSRSRALRIKERRIHPANPV